MPIKDKIKEINFFNDLDQVKLDELANISVLKKYEKNNILYYEGEDSNNILFLLTGFIKIYKVDKFDNEIFLYYIQNYSMISELTCLEDKKIHSFSNAEFTEDSVVLSIDYTKFKEKFLDKNILLRKLTDTILNKTHQLQYVLNRELVFDASAKVAYMISNDLDIFNKLKRQEVSFMLHIQPETLSRVLKKFVRNEIILIESSNISIIDEESLKSIFRGVAL